MNRSNSCAAWLRVNVRPVTSSGRRDCASAAETVFAMSRDRSGNRTGSRDDKRLDVGARPGTVSFGEDGRERVYLAVMDSGRVYRFDPK